jgi:hypothetical protein
MDESALRRAQDRPMKVESRETPNRRPRQAREKRDQFFDLTFCAGPFGARAGAPCPAL